MSMPADSTARRPKRFKILRLVAGVLLSLVALLCAAIAAFAYAEPFLHPQRMSLTNSEGGFDPGPDWRNPGYVFNVHAAAMVNVREGLKACAVEDWEECAHQLRMAKADDPTLDTNADVVSALARANAALDEIAKRQLLEHPQSSGW
jgi:hypothetical protein